jgi:DNA-binding MarR family transcriptional regulator
MVKSIFHLETQNANLESKIAVALERVSEAFRVALWNEAKAHTLSPIQMQILIFLAYHNSQNHCKVGYLAKEFNLTKPTISDAVKTLLQKRLVTKISDPTDTRSHFIELTPKGMQLAKQTSNFILPLQQPITQLTEKQKIALYDALLDLIYKLTQSGIISVQRMCFTCKHFNNEDLKGYYCNLLERDLPNTDLRVDCPEHLYKD